MIPYFNVAVKKMVSCFRIFKTSYYILKVRLFS